MTTETISVSTQIINKKGLHARASAKFVETVARFRAEVTVSKDENRVSGRSIMGLMMLGASQGTTIGLVAEGPEARQVIDSLVQLIAAKFHEDA